MIERITERTGNQLKIFAPAKINLFLAIDGKRKDGFHNLTTILAKLSIGDSLQIRRVAGNQNIQLSCPGYNDLEGKNNLAWLAAEKWFQRSGEKWSVEILLKKEILPMSGLGGGSSNAVSTLFAMNELGDIKLPREGLIELAAEIGSDCPCFFESGLCVAQGRGERVSALNHPVARGLIGHDVLLFRPNVGLSTKEVYKRLSQIKQYSSIDWTSTRVKEWESSHLSTPDFLHNDLESAVFSKHIYFSVLFDRIKTNYGLNPSLSGSGSCCFVLVPKDFKGMRDLQNEIFLAWGADAWVKCTKVIH